MELLKAIRANDYKKVEKRLKKGTDVNIEILESVNGRKIYTLPLCLATARGYLQIADLLIAMGADIHHGNSDWSPPLHSATFHGHLALLKMLLDRRVSLDNQDIHGDTALNVAIKKRNLDAVKILLRYEPQLEIKNYQQENALTLIDELNGTGLLKHQEIYDLIKSKQQHEFDGYLSRNHSQTSNEVNRNHSQRSSSSYENNSDISEKEKLKHQLKQLETLEINEEIKTKKKEVDRLTFEIEEDKEEAKRLDKALKTLEKKLKSTRNALLTKEAIMKSIADDIKQLETKKTIKLRGDEVKDDSIECPICFCVPLPPKVVYQCKNGHIHCDVCLKKIDQCPQCRITLDKKEPIRNRAVEEIIANIYSTESNF